MVLITLPAYNEQDALPPLLAAFVELQAQGFTGIRVIVVDDGSADRTADIVREYHARHEWITLVQHEGNRGLSQAIRTGFDAALAQAGPDDLIVTLDADNTQPPATIPAMIEKLSEGYDVVIASRFRPGARVYGVPPLRRLYSRVLSILFQIAYPVRGVRDYSCGFRAYRAATLQRAYDVYGDEFITEQGFACMVEILFQLDHLRGVRFAEVPFTLHYDFKPTETKMNVTRTIRETLALALRHRLRPPRN